MDRVEVHTKFGVMFAEKSSDQSYHAPDIIQLTLKDRGRTQKSLAEELGIGAQTFSKKLVNDTLTAREFIAAINALGLTMTFTDKTTGAEVKERKLGVIPRVSMVVDGIRYDTFKADALCHTQLDAWTLELYKDAQGRHFLAISSAWDGAKSALIPCKESDAMQFYEAHRDDYSDTDG